MHDLTPQFERSAEHRAAVKVAKEDREDAREIVIPWRQYAAMLDAAVVKELRRGTGREAAQ